MDLTHLRRGKRPREKQLMSSEDGKGNDRALDLGEGVGIGVICLRNLLAPVQW